MDVTTMLIALAQRGKKMRDKQIQFFKHRSATNLNEAKEAEREFDTYLDYLKKQGIDVVPPTFPTQQSLL